MFSEISDFLSISKNAIELLKIAKELVPEGKKRQQISAKISAASRELQLAEALLAKDLGYQLCQCTFPPQIMLFTGNKQYQYQCQKCKFIVDKSARVAIGK